MSESGSATVPVPALRDPADDPLIKSNKIVTVISAADFRNLNDFSLDLISSRSATVDRELFTSVEPDLAKEILELLGSEPRVPYVRDARPFDLNWSLLLGKPGIASAIRYVFGECPYIYAIATRGGCHPRYLNGR